MRIIIDADGCPVVHLSVSIAKKHGIEAIIVCDCAHVFDLPGVETITVTKGADSADFRIANMISAGDIVVTQDYGLAAMCLARKAIVINQNGHDYTEDNIDSMLLARHTARKIRNTGGRLKGPSKRTAEQDKAFADRLNALLEACKSSVSPQ
ncbi:MAG: YaiI/YqxD family protein [Clostridia bacterium]|nr:YaiI/YqxD family protein [Clostridia bacterium]